LWPRDPNMKINTSGICIVKLNNSPERVGVLSRGKLFMILLASHVLWTRVWFSLSQEYEREPPGKVLRITLATNCHADILICIFVCHKGMRSFCLLFARKVLLTVSKAFSWPLWKFKRPRPDKGQELTTKIKLMLGCMLFKLNNPQNIFLVFATEPHRLN